MRRVLIITSAFAPTMVADMHRTRHLAWELPDLGWEVEVLIPSTQYQDPTCVDSDSDGFFPAHLTAHNINQLGPRMFRALGIGSIGWRALLSLWSAGKRLFQQRQFDLIYISTTQFPLVLLGPTWQKAFGIPYVLDIHDPVFNERSECPVWAEPRLKHRISRAISKHLEEYAARFAQGLIAVSPHYIDDLRRRHGAKNPPWLHPGRHDVIPFAGRLGDLSEVIAKLPPYQKLTAPLRRIVYVGAGGPIMRRSFTLFSRSLAQLRQRAAELCDGIRIELYGTVRGWKPGDERYLAEIASSSGIGDLVREEPDRVSYRHSLELLLQSDGAVVFGVEDPAYMPSKLFSYALSGKPLFAVLHRDGSAFAQFQRPSGLGHVIWFDQNHDMPLDQATSVLEVFLREVAEQQMFDRKADITAYLAPAMAQRHVELFEACLDHPGPLNATDDVSEAAVVS